MNLKMLVIVLLSCVVGFIIETFLGNGLGFVTVFMGVAISYTLLVIVPIRKLVSALKLIDFDADKVDFSKLDKLTYTDKDLHFILSKFNYLADSISARINMINETIEVAETDGLTGCYNRVYLDMKKGEYTNSSNIFIIFIDVNNLKKMNDIYGHEAGDNLIKSAANHLRYWSKFGDVYRLGGDEFMVVITGISPDKVNQMINVWYPKVGSINRKTDGFQCRLAYGTSWGERFSSIDDLIKQADARMYEHKKKIKIELGEPLTREEK